jgi:hypothetical protein
MNSIIFQRKVKVITATIVMATMASSALAQSVFMRDKNSCYQRTYSASHLKSHPQQTVSFIQVTHSVAENAKLFEGYGSSSDQAKEPVIKVSVKFKGNPKTYSNNLVCSEDSKFCGVECDGGRAAFTRKANGALLLDVRNTGGFILEGGCDAGNGSRTKFLGDAQDDKLFKLNSMNMNACSGPES